MRYIFFSFFLLKWEINDLFILFSEWTWNIRNELTRRPRLIDLSRKQTNFLKKIITTSCLLFGLLQSYNGWNARRKPSITIIHLLEIQVELTKNLRIRRCVILHSSFLKYPVEGSLFYSIRFAVLKGTIDRKIDHDYDVRNY